MNIKNKSIFIFKFLKNIVVFLKLKIRLMKVFDYLQKIANITVIGIAACGIGFYAKYGSKFQKYIGGSKIIYYSPERYVGKTKDALWAEKIMGGGYILHFRHAEREKWKDTQVYDSLETVVLKNKSIRLAEEDYFKDAVCLNKRGKIQARAINEHLKNINLPIGYVISSPSCRARQTAEIGFGGYSKLDRNLVHSSPYTEKMEQRIKNLKGLYLSLPIEKGFNTIVSAHNGVIVPQILDNEEDNMNIALEEGGFYILSRKDNKLILEHEFNNFAHFIRHFYKR